MLVSQTQLDSRKKPGSLMGNGAWTPPTVFKGMFGTVSLTSVPARDAEATSARSFVLRPSAAGGSVDKNQQLNNVFRETLN